MKFPVKRCLTILLGLFLVMGSVACGESPATNAATTTTASGTSAAAQQRAAPPQEETANFNAEGFPILNEPESIKVCGPLNAMTPTWKDMNFFTYITGLTGIEFTFEEYSGDVWSEKKSLLFASDDLPDLFIGAGFTAKELLEYGSQGQLVALNDMIESYGPEIVAAFEDAPDAKAISTSPDGNIYALPLINQIPRDMHRRYWISNTWLDNVGMEVPSTLDELAEILRAFKERDANGNGDPGDEIPLTGFAGDTIDGLILNAMGVVPVARTSAVKFQMVAADGKVACLNTLPQYKEYLLLLNEWYKEGLLDNDLFVQTTEQMDAKGHENKLGIFTSSASYMTCGSEIGYDYTQFDALTSSLSSKKIVSSATGISGGVTAITRENKIPEATLRMLDYCFSEEGSQICRNGEEGIGWNWTDEAAGTWENLQPEGYDNTQAWRAMVVPISQVATWYRIDYQLGQGSENAIWLNGMTDAYSFAYFTSEYPALNFTDAELERIAPIENDLITYAAEARARFITGEDDIEKNWEQYVQTMEKMGLQTIVDIHQPQYDSYTSSMK